MVDQRELEQSAHAGEVVEPRTADLGTAFDVDRAEQLAELDVVADRESLGCEVTAYADLLDDDEVVLAADGRCRIDEVGQLAEQALGQRVRRVARILGRLHARCEVGRLGHDGVELGLDRRALVVARLLETPLERTDRLAELLLLVAQCAEGDLGAAPLLVGCDEAVDDRLVLTSGALRGAHTVGVVAQELEIDHGRSLSSATPQPPSRCATPGSRGTSYAWVGIHVTAVVVAIACLNDHNGGYVEGCRRQLGSWAGRQR